VTNPVVHP